jgi:geranylgeranyl pyrophosphate synthase
VLADLVAGELMQLQQKGEEEEEERFQQYLDKSFNKTASLMAYSCKVRDSSNILIKASSRQPVLRLTAVR